MKKFPRQAAAPFPSRKDATHGKSKPIMPLGDERSAAGKVRARLLVPIKGKFTSWKRGQIVLAERIGQNSYAIERLRWIGADGKPAGKNPLRRMPLNNVLVGVPHIALEFLA